MIDKRQILREIHRLANANRGVPPGRLVFERETSIKQSDWYPDIWLRWSEALAEAGYAPNRLTGRMSDELVIQKYISLMRELGKVPVAGEIRRKGKQDKSFPSHLVFDRFGGKERLIAAVVGYCRENGGFDDILTICAEHGIRLKQDPKPEREQKRVLTGFVYLMKSGRHYKIGRTNSVARRQGELAIKIPVPPKNASSN